MRGLVEGNYETAFHGFREAQPAWRSVFPRDSVPNLTLFFDGLSAAHSNRVPDAIGIFRRLLHRSSVEESRDTTRQIPLQTNEFRWMLAYLLQRSNERAEAEAKTSEARATLTRFVEAAPSRYGAAVRDARARLAQLP